MVEHITITNKKASDMEVMYTVLFVHQRNVYDISTLRSRGEETRAVMRNEIPIFGSQRDKIVVRKKKVIRLFGK